MFLSKGKSSLQKKTKKGVDSDFYDCQPDRADVRLLVNIVNKRHLCFPATSPPPPEKVGQIEATFHGFLALLRLEITNSKTPVKNLDVSIVQCSWDVVKFGSFKICTWSLLSLDWVELESSSSYAPLFFYSCLVFCFVFNSCFVFRVKWDGEGGAGVQRGRQGVRQHHHLAQGGG